MAEYIGSKCISCGNTFSKDDDIVVCPDCGTPYHRDCYLKEGNCINTKLHISGESWKSDILPSVEDFHNLDGKNICASCGWENSIGVPFCDRCGKPIPKAMFNSESLNENKGDYSSNSKGIDMTDINPYLINFSDPLCGYDPNEEFEDTRVCEMADYIGTNTRYYLPLFKYFKKSGRKFSFNFSALLMPELFFANRKMILPAIACILLKIFLRIPYFMLLGNDSTYNWGFITEFASGFDVKSGAFQVLYTMFSVLNYAFMFATGFFANWLYYRKVLTDIPEIRRKTPPQNLRSRLSQKGGTSPIALSLIIIAYVIVAVGLSLYLSPFNLG